MTFAKMCRTPLIIRHFPDTRSYAALQAADLGLSDQNAFRGRTFGRFPASLFASGAQLELDTYSYSTFTG